jgi:hypothetical protein
MNKRLKGIFSGGYSLEYLEEILEAMNHLYWERSRQSHRMLLVTNQHVRVHGLSYGRELKQAMRKYTSSQQRLDK